MQTNDAGSTDNFIIRCATKIRQTFKKSLMFRRLTVVVLALAIISGSVFSVAALSKTVRITDGNNTVSVVTFNTDTDMILQSAGIVCADDDVVIANNNNGQLDITVYRSFEVEIITNGNSSTHSFNMGTVADALQKAGIVYDDNDMIVPSLSTELSNGLSISVTHMSEVTIKADGETKKCLAPSVSVEASLSYAGVSIDDDDIITPERGSYVNDGASIVVQRVEYKEAVKTKKINYKTITKDTSSLYIGEQEVETAGSKGEETYTVRDMYVDGKLKSSEVINSKVTKKPVDEVLLCGTKKKQLASGSIVAGNGSLIDADGNKVSYTKLISGTCTAYSYSTGNITSTGQYARMGLVAVNPNIIPYGTQLYIASPDGSVVYGYAVAADTGGALMDGRVLVDLFYNTDDECFQFGRRTMNVYVLG